MNYLDIDFKESFDIATLIFYDFCALATTEPKLSAWQSARRSERQRRFYFRHRNGNKKTRFSTSITVCEGGFWRPNPYVEILNTYLYEDPKTEGLTILD
jgi:hypothetical protein